MCRAKKKGPFERALIAKFDQAKKERGLTRMHVSWGPEAHKMSREERAKAVIEFMEASERQDAKPERQKMMEAMTQAHEALRKITKLCQVNIREWVIDGEVNPEFGKLSDEVRNEIFGLAESASWPLGNFVRNKGLHGGTKI